MAARELINLGITPDSGTGDTARRGGAKINDLFADIYTIYGDNPIGNDPDGPFYGYRRNFDEFEYRVGELHATGRWQNIKYSGNNANTLREDGGLLDRNLYGTGTVSYNLDRDNNYDTNPNNVPEVFVDQQMYFATRGEQIDVDLTDMPNNGVAHLVLPIAREGDVIRIRETQGSLGGGRVLSIWTTPLTFRSQAQVNEWRNNDEYAVANGNALPPVHTSATNPGMTTIRNRQFTRINASIMAVPAEYGIPAIPFGAAGTIDLNPDTFDSDNLRIVSGATVDNSNTIYEFIYLGHNFGWVFNQRTLFSNQPTTRFVTLGDDFTAEEWFQLPEDLIAPDGTSINRGMYMLPIAPSGANERERDIEVGQIINYRIFRQIIDDSDSAADADAFFSNPYDPLEGTISLQAALQAAIEAQPDSENAIAIRYKTVLGTDISNGFRNREPTDMFREVTVPTIVDGSGNLVIFTDLPFDGSAVLFYPFAE